VFALSVFSLIGFYAAVHGFAHHHGTVFVAAIMGTWVAWPAPDEERVFTERDKLYMRGMIALLIILCAVNTWDAVVVIQREYRYPYSGAGDAATYLKAAGADRGDVFGYMFGMNAVQAYFDQKILSNWPTSYVHASTAFKIGDVHIDQIERIRPEYIVVSAGVRQEELQGFLNLMGQPLSAAGYELVHISDGYQFTKRSVYERDVYFIFRRIHPN
jgi:hypothetical protein